MKIIIGTKNKNKLQEIEAILKEQTIIGLDEINEDDDIEEFGHTLHQNALIKAEYLHKKYPLNSIVTDDSGIFIKALNDQPGVYSARYASEDPIHKENPGLANNRKVLNNLKGESSRIAEYRTVICLIVPGDEPVFFSGILEGEIALEMIKEEGFGYDPIFLYKNERLSEYPIFKKNKISHRKIALEKMNQYLASKVDK